MALSSALALIPEEQALVDNYNDAWEAYKRSTLLDDKAQRLADDALYDAIRVLSDYQAKLEREVFAQLAV